MPDDLAAAPVTAGPSSKRRGRAKRLSPDLVEEIRIAYEGSRASLRTIGEGFGMSAPSIAKQAKARGWLRRREPLPGDPLDRAALVKRLFHAAERQLSEIERRLSRIEGAPVDERDARALAALARTLELLIGLEKTALPQEPVAEVDADDLRRDLARRIAALVG
jgi:hypothetical protein